MKHRYLKFLISVVFYGTQRARDSLYGLFGRQPKGTLVTLLYHSVRDVDRAGFAAQMAELQRIATPVEAGYAGPFEPGRHYVAVTFDDGYQNLLDNAIPELLRRGIPATVFIPTGYLGRCPDWIDEKDHAYLSEMVVTEPQLKDLATKPGITVGSHFVTHPRVSSLSEEEARREMRESREFLENTLGREVSLLAFPYGDFTEESLTWAQEAGYKHAYNILPSLGDPSRDPFFAGRVDLNCDESSTEFRLLLRGAFDWLSMACDLKRKLRGAARQEG